jgi:hypothetical protein
MNYQLYNVRIQFIIGSETYKVNQDPETGIAIDDQRTLEGVKSPTGDYVKYRTQNHMPYSIDFAVIGLNNAKYDLLTDCWNNGTEFSVVMSGLNDMGENVKTTLKRAHFRQSPIQTSIEQNKAIIRLLLYCSDIVREIVS